MLEYCCWFFFFHWSIVELNVVLLSGVQQSESVIHIHRSTFL